MRAVVAIDQAAPDRAGEAMAASDHPPHGRVLVAGGLLLIVIAVLAIGVGTSWLSPAKVVSTLLGQGSGAQEHIVLGLRLPRILLAMLAGAMLAVSGALLQTLSRNDLADPSLLGVTAGAALAIVALQAWQPGAPGWAVSAAGLGGALLAGLLVAWLGRGADPVRFLLHGVLVGAALSAALSVLLSLRGELLGTVLRWVVGSIAARTWADVLTVLPWAVGGALLTLACVRIASLLWLGPDMAASLGTSPVAGRAWVLLTSLVLSAGAVAAVGAMAFVGLLGPHLARGLVGRHPVRVIGFSALIGALLLLGADTLAQLASLIPASEAGRTALPAGAVTAVLGGPLLLVLLARTERR